MTDTFLVFLIERNQNLSSVKLRGVGVFYGGLSRFIQKPTLTSRPVWTARATTCREKKKAGSRLAAYAVKRKELYARLFLYVFPDLPSYSDRREWHPSFDWKFT